MYLLLGPVDRRDAGPVLQMLCKKVVRSQMLQLLLSNVESCTPSIRFDSCVRLYFFFKSEIVGVRKYRMGFPVASLGPSFEM